MKKSKLTIKQKKFVVEYVKTGNATQAYLKAGYSMKSKDGAGVEGKKLLRNPKIKLAISKALEKIEDHKIMKAKEALQGLTSIARGKASTIGHAAVAKQMVSFKILPTITERERAYEDILKRYPVSEMDKADIKKAQAEAIRAEAEANVAKAQAEQLHTVANTTRDKMEKLSMDDLRKIAKLAGDENA